MPEPTAVEMSEDLRIIQRELRERIYRVWGRSFARHARHLAPPGWEDLAMSLPAAVPITTITGSSQFQMDITTINEAPIA